MFKKARVVLATCDTKLYSKRCVLLLLLLPVEVSKLLQLILSLPCLRVLAAK